MVEQVTVFLGNEKGRLSALCRTLGNAGVNMHALTIAESSDYGLVRIICDSPAQAADALVQAGYIASVNEVLAVPVADTPGGLAQVLEVLEAAGINVEYGYCFASGEGKACDVLRVHDGERASQLLAEAGFEPLEPADVYAASAPAAE